ncbi:MULTISPECIES: SDR family NAD(P)-dependent oxidoreductase [unclassified Paenibacillus]|uniref:SDR family NAD(P)-dependent oxidoreductase n=1 Tax=unclassified Paenibacillus TaxID=185978 RepID=UPI0008383326|nr:MULTISPECIES: SDR family NAD(P)-dependent oxidoreductase [unclassified Paenibacillus]NWL86495.1 KR domain-containing protein [Paenibacillus sp. 79R4]
MRDRMVVIISGANSGIGRAAASRFASAGFHVVMACRDLSASRSVQQEIIEKSGNDNVSLLELDLASLSSIRHFCSTFRQTFDQLDVLIHNAAYLKHGVKTYQLSPDQIELSFATNLIGPYLMTKLLMEPLRKSSDARILHACSTNIKHFFDPKRKIEFDNLQGEFKDKRPYSTYKMYGDSKMALFMMTKRLAEELKPDHIQVNALQIPATQISKRTIDNLSPIWRTLAVLQNLFNPLPDEVAECYYQICTAEKYANLSGHLFNKQGEVILPGLSKPDPLTQAKQIFGSTYYPAYADDPDTIQQVWELCTKWAQH